MLLFLVGSWDYCCKQALLSDVQLYHNNAKRKKKKCNFDGAPGGQKAKSIAQRWGASVRKEASERANRHAYGCVMRAKAFKKEETPAAWGDRFIFYEYVQEKVWPRNVRKRSGPPPELGYLVSRKTACSP